MEANHFCLNVINRTSLPEFIELTFEHFPYVFAFHESNYFELRDAGSRWRFFQRILCTMPTRMCFADLIAST